MSTPPPLIDSHCHLELNDFGDERSAVIERARSAGLVHFVAVGSGSSLDNVRNAIDLAETDSDFSAAIGIHPHDVVRMSEADISAIETLAATHPKVVAIGETGLDYHYNHSPRDVQQAAFRRFIVIARKTHKPLTLHIRDAHGDARTILTEERAFDVPIVVHCFTGTVDDARAYLDLGCYLSFSGILTFKSADEIRRAAAFAPTDRILIETDCPYLAPIPYRGKRNEPSYLVETARVLSETRGVSLEQTAAASVAATRRAFGLPTPLRA